MKSLLIGSVFPRQRSRSGFSLVELLVSIAVIAILTTITAGAIGHVRKSAMRAQNATNLKGLMAAWNLYATDNDGFFPIGLTWAATSDSVTNPPLGLRTYNYRYWWRWHGGIAGYLPTLVPRDTEAFNNYEGPRAPAWSNMYAGYFSPRHIDEAKRLQNAHVGYHFNRYIGLSRRTSLNDMTNPSRTPILFAYWDERRALEERDPSNQYFSSAVAADANSADFMLWGTDTMGGGNHFAFADGRVEWVPKMNTLEEYNENMQWRLATP